MTVLYDKNEDQKWIAYCPNLPSIKGIGDTQAEALIDLTERIRAILTAIISAQNRLCDM